jgi:hypothetical protein
VQDGRLRDGKGDAMTLRPRERWQIGAAAALWVAALWFGFAVKMAVVLTVVMICANVLMLAAETWQLRWLRLSS